MTEAQTDPGQLKKLLPHTMGAERYRLSRRLSNAGKDPQRLEEAALGILESVEQRRRRAEELPAPDYPEELPITARKDEIVAAIQRNQVIILSGETGSGKSTQIPKMCLEAGRGIDGQIGCTQPRRIAALSLASRVADELGDGERKWVSSKIRFQGSGADDAYIKFMTDGILLAETQSDRFLNRYDTLIIDEAHERSLNIDLILGILRKLLKKRRDLKLIITSATIDTEKFSAAFDSAPIFEVSGRTYPVEVIYQPQTSGSEDLSYVEQAVAAVENICRTSRDGDVLVFMPTEADIRETCDGIEGLGISSLTVLPLFARLTSAAQSRIFATHAGRKVVVATNVAETSITIPGIVYVVDTGLARISTYSPASRTTALPVSPISRSSADQRKGRAGRVRPGVCIRLYPEEDYQSREEFTRPEILRDNLADVILRMVSLRLGDVEDFPFIDKPSTRHLSDGIGILRELGAVTRNRQGGLQLTRYGRLMARLPLDPRFSRMLIEAAEQGILRDAAVIVSVLTIQDPRDRPQGEEDKADSAHKKYHDPESDFVSLLNIWEEYHQVWRQVRSQGRMRKYCSQNYLSYRRMKEWRDIHLQVTSLLKEQGYEIKTPDISRKPEKKGEPSPWYTALHISVLTGLLSNIAEKKEKNIYTAARNREAMIFPGSGLFGNGPGWLVAAEMVRTSRLFARTCAGIEPAWLERIATGQCSYSYHGATWAEKQMEVTAVEQVRLYGLLINPGRTVAYGKINPGEASDIFIREGIMEGRYDLRRIHRILPVLEKNGNTLKGILKLEEKLRRRDIYCGDEELFRFYRERIPREVYDFKGLEKYLKESGEGIRKLELSREDIMLYNPDSEILERFPSEAVIDGHRIDLEYVFDPQRPEDGVTALIPERISRDLTTPVFDWLVPGLFEEKVSTLMKGLPKEYRRRLAPVSESAGRVARNIPRNTRERLVVALSRYIQEDFGFLIPESAWDEESLPPHLKMRFTVVDARGRRLTEGRDREVLTSAGPSKHLTGSLERLKRSWEIEELRIWDFDEIPERVEGDDGLPAFPALTPEGTQVALRLYLSAEEAAGIHPDGVALLVYRSFSDILKTFRHELMLGKEYQMKVLPFGGLENFNEGVWRSLTMRIFRRSIRSRSEYQEFSEWIKPRLYSELKELYQPVLRVLEEYAQVRECLSRLESREGSRKGVKRFLSVRRKELENLVPREFFRLYDKEELKEVPRFLRALKTRIEKGAVNPAADAEKASALIPYLSWYRETRDLLKERSGMSYAKRQALKEYRWALEEYKIQLFAQEMGTRIKISPQRLDRRIRTIEEML
ncbi:ATP-dependent RNA helicase HrpA [Marispirochaeta aestuarii]|uniref:ATP-dependent RNA helicase HrpA n=1 Tax=Marispirochaeta aestuarii TaxID=1963862 RepID=UPI0029C83B7F|nr:ATP-dependent RNA helicase HrpA [Marispirochaeta aestuarii]